MLLFFAVAGCHGPNHFMAEDVPLESPLRLASRSNPQTVDLSRLASSTGGNEIIGPGDVLDITIAAGLKEDDQITRSVRVGNDGNGILSEIGSVPLAGYAPESAEAIIANEAIRKNLYRSPAVTVTFKERRVNRVRVLGAVKEPGSYALLPNSSDVVSAIAAAGGLAEDAGENVEIRNPSVGIVPERPSVAGTDGTGVSPVSSTSGGRVGDSRMNSYTVNLISAAKEGDGGYVVHDGGVIMVEKRDLQPVTVTGLVRKADQYPIPVGKDLTVLQAIALAGGPSNQLADKVYLIRRTTNTKDPAVIQLSMREAKKSGRSDLLVGPGDIISVEQTPSTFLLEALQIIRFGVSASAGTFL